MADWYYIGHYGQLGPLSREQMDELVQGGVIARDTYVWHAGMVDWTPADRVTDLQDVFRAAEPFVAPPPPPSPPRSFEAPAPPAASAPDYRAAPMAYEAAYMRPLSTVRSDRSRALGGILQLFLPGVGRMYLGYSAIGVLQLVLCGVGWIWSFIDGIIILTGGVRMDGYGRHLSD